jgi:acetyl-CoA acetyltransferase
MTGVRILSTAIHPFGRHDLSAIDMGARAVHEALTTAGDGGRFDAAFCGTAYGGVAAGHRVLAQLGRTGGPIIDVEAGCASGAAALSLAAAAIQAGQYRRVLIFGIEKMPKGIIRSSFFDPWREQLGLASTPAYFALRAQRLMVDSGVTKDHLARVVVKNRANGVHNDAAMFRKPVAVDEVLASRVVCEPLHLFMLCSPNEGAAAVVLDGSTGGVQLRACALRSHLPGHVLNEGSPLSGLPDARPTPPTALAVADAYAIAGLGPDDLDLVEVQDTDAARELLAYEELGLCPSGAAGELLDSGATQPDGRIPVNVSGGLLSKGEPLGASALGQVVEVTRQLEGLAGPRQVTGARVGLTQTVGRGANASVCILTR